MSEQQSSEARVHEQARLFARRFSIRPKDAPSLILDFSWPSIGIVDLITQPIRFRTEHSPLERLIIHGAACYLGYIAAQCWKAFGAKVEIKEDPERGVILTALEGPELNGATFTVEIEAELIKILRQPPSPFPVIADFSRPVTPDHNLISLFAIGLFTGLSPFGKGPWAEMTPDAFQRPIAKIIKLLAGSCSDRYERVFPSEMWGRVAELYLHQLIFPPTLAVEELPGLNAARGLLDFADQYKLGHGDLYKLATNLAQIPDEVMSNVGLATVAALARELPSPQVIAVAQSRGMYAGLLRGCMLFLREELKLRPDWMLQQKFEEEDRFRYELEQSLQLLPWVKIPQSRAHDKKLAGLLLALSVFDMENAKKFADSIIDETPGDIAVRLQRTYLDVIGGDLDRADATFRNMATEPGAEFNGQLFSQWGLSDLARGDRDAALRHLEVAFRMMDLTDNLQRSIPNDYAWVLILNEQFERASDVLELAEQQGSNLVTTLLNQAYCKTVLGKLDEADQIHERLLQLAPLDFRVFGNFFNLHTGQGRPPAAVEE